MNNPFEIKNNRELEAIERKILNELIKISRNPKLTIDNLVEWSAQKFEHVEGETIHYLPEMKLYVKVQ